MKVSLSLLFAWVTCIALLPRAAEAKSRMLYFPEKVEDRASTRYAELKPEACLRELTARDFPYLVVEPRGHIETALRITGDIHGITFRPTFRPNDAPEPLSGLLDCRLALALDDLARVLKSEGITEAEYLCIYRPGRWIKAGRRHPSGLAIDLARVRLQTGEWSDVSHDFSGRIGSRTCGADAAAPKRPTAESALWRRIVCRIDDMGSFNLSLSPNYNWGHRDHLHMEVRTEIRWVLVQ